MNLMFDRLYASLIESYQIAPESVILNADFSSLNMDSLEVAEMLFNIEDEFKITFPSEPDQLPTVGDGVRYIASFIFAQGEREAQKTTVEPAIQIS